MKRLLGFALAITSIVFFSPTYEAKAAAASEHSAKTFSASSGGQWGYDRYGRRYNRRRARTVRRTRIVRYGGRVYRETYAITYFRNGRTYARLISRVRIA